MSQCVPADGEVQAHTAGDEHGNAVARIPLDRRYGERHQHEAKPEVQEHIGYVEDGGTW